MKKKMNSKKGFTLVEIIVVLVILAIMAGFAIPAYNGFVERARQSEILASARVLLIAAQTAGQEKYALKGEDLTASLSSTADSDAAELLTQVEAYADLEDTSATYTLSFDLEGKVTDVVYSDGTYKATYEDDEWTTAKLASGVTITTLLTIGTP